MPIAVEGDPIRLTPRPADALQPAVRKNSRHRRCLVGGVDPSIPGDENLLGSLDPVADRLQVVDVHVRHAHPLARNILEARLDPVQAWPHR